MAESVRLKKIPKKFFKKSKQFIHVYFFTKCTSIYNFLKLLRFSLKIYILHVPFFTWSIFPTCVLNYFTKSFFFLQLIKKLDKNWNRIDKWLSSMSMRFASGCTVRKIRYHQKDWKHLLDRLGYLRCSMLT